MKNMNVINMLAPIVGSILMLAGTPTAGFPDTQPIALSTQDLGGWVKSIQIPGSNLQNLVLEQQFLSDTTIHPFSKQQLVGLGVSGSVQLKGEQSLVRILLLDDQLNEYLVYEVYPLIAPANAFQIRDVCRETCMLPAIVPSALKVELIDASLEIQTVTVNQITSAGAAGTTRIAQSRQLTEKVKNTQEAEIIELLNRQIKARGLKWIAGETAISRLSYAEKKRLFGRDTLPNLQGFEYYKGGIFAVTPKNSTTSSPRSGSSSLINSFDWRNRHGANKPGSPYYDGDSTGSGWITSVKSQLCADCWAHSAIGATEAQVNLYFNQHLDLDLSEQELVSCSGAGSCQYGGDPGAALSYISSVGVVNESCFPESGIDEACNVCPMPQERIQITGYEYIDPYIGEDNIKRRLIRFGPLTFGISSWWHAMLLIGYERDMDTGETVWILKNSWGTSWGENGYGYLKVSLSDIYLTYQLHSPVTSLITPYEIACRDADSDGYYNWGLSEKPPASCKNVPAVKDCDDSDPTVALLKDDGSCVALDIPDCSKAKPSVALLWPPDHRFIPISILGVTDPDGDSVTIKVTGIYQDEAVNAKGSGNTAPDGLVDGTNTAQVRAERVGSGNGRVYHIGFTAEDDKGGSCKGKVLVGVPHDQGQGATPVDDGALYDSMVVQVSNLRSPSR